MQLPICTQKPSRKDLASKPPFLMGLSIVVFVGAMMAIIISAIASYDDVRASFFVHDFINAPGIIVATKIEYRTTKNSGCYAPDIVYRYRVGKKWLQSNNLIFKLGTCGSKKAAIAWLYKYPVGKLVTVSYSASDPHLVALEADKKTTLFGEFVISTIALLLAMVTSSSYLCY